MRYRPDRNAAPEAASMMAAINEAYCILGEPARRRRYDQERKRREAFEIAGPILRAAEERLHSGTKNRSGNLESLSSLPLLIVAAPPRRLAEDAVSLVDSCHHGGRLRGRIPVRAVSHGALPVW